MLTKAQKLEMVSKAIDAGFHIELRLHFVNDLETLDEKLEVFTGLPIEMHCGEKTKTTWAKVNPENGFDDKFEASVFL